MGRYYNGDIEGKFWFAVQASDAAERFGGNSYVPEYTIYEFSKDDLSEIEAEIAKIEKKLEKHKKAFDSFFEANNSYNGEMLTEYFKELGLPLKDLRKHLSDYADLGLGIQIRDCVKNTGYCNFEAEH